MQSCNFFSPCQFGLDKQEIDLLSFWFTTQSLIYIIMRIIALSYALS